MMRNSTLGWIAAVLAACGGSDNVRPDGSTDASAGSPLSVRVSNTGNDLHNGVDMPVETLKRAIEIATAEPRVTEILLEAGQYTTRRGEAFPYTVPPNVEIAGPVGGGAILVGTGTEDGLIVKGGQLEDVELDNFLDALEVEGSVRIKNVRIASRGVAVRAGRRSKLRVTDLDISAPDIGQVTCPTGIMLGMDAELVITNLTTRNIGAALDAAQGAAVDIVGANIVAGVPDTRCGSGGINVASAKAFALSDSVIEGGPRGISLLGSSGEAAISATITNTEIRNVESGVFASGLDLQVTGTSITGRGNSLNAIAFAFSGGTASLTDVTISTPAVFAIQIGVPPVAQTGPAAMTIRRCTVSSGGVGIRLLDRATVDLGTIESPGLNRLEGFSMGLDILGTTSPTRIQAVGNTWRPNVQGADENGHYLSQTIFGPVRAPVGGNFSIGDGWSLQL